MPLFVLLTFILAPLLHGKSTIEHGLSLRRGRRMEMEDRSDVLHPVGNSTATLYAVYDGHGGSEVAQLLQKHLLKQVAANLNDSEPEAALVSAFDTLETMVDEMEHADQCGCTAVVALVDRSNLHVAVVGNSIALLCTQEVSLLLTIPHDLSLNHDELLRVKMAGGTISDHSGGKKRLESDIELSRSFGDTRYRHIGLISKPEVYQVDLRGHQESSDQFLFLLLLSDGVVENLSYDEVCSHAKAQHLGLKRPALSPPQPPPIALSASRVSTFTRVLTQVSVIVSLLLQSFADLLPFQPPASLTPCCDCLNRSTCQDQPTTAKSAQSVAERITTEAFNRGSSDNLAVLAVNLALSEPSDSLVLPGSLSYTLTTRLASLPSILDPSLLHGHKSQAALPYFQYGFWEHLLLSDDLSTPITKSEAIAMTEAIPCLGFNVGDGAVALRDSMLGLDIACSLVNDLVVASSVPSFSEQRSSRVLLSFEEDEGKENTGNREDMIIGSGSFGSVWRAKSKGNHESFVIKKLDHRKKEAIESGEREAHFGRLLSKHVPSRGHDHIVRFVEHFYSEEKQSQGRDLFLVFADAGSSLHDLAYQPSESRDHQWAIVGPSDWWRKHRRDQSSSNFFMRNILHQLLTALDQIHALGIVHRDIKPENIMVQRDGSEEEVHIRVIDFGSSLDEYTLRHLFRQSRLSSAQTTLEYAPPEQLFGSRFWETMATESHIHPFAQASDIWAVGVVALELILGTPNVFELSDAERKTFEKKLKAAGRDPSSHRLLLLLRGMLELCIHPSMRLDVDRKTMPGNHVASIRCSDSYFGQKIKERDPMSLGIPAQAIDLVRRLLHWDVAKRISAREALDHPFFNQ